MELNWKVILGPELMCKINDMLEKLKVEGMAANVEVSGNVIQAQIQHSPTGRDIIQIRIIPR